jgi:molecular chaperone DnaK
MSYQVGVDVGATFTTAAVVRGGRAEVVSMVPTHLPGVPRGFLRRVGDDTPVLVGARPVPAESLVAQLISQVVATIGKPTSLAVTHPVSWGAHRVAALRAALGEVTMLSTAAAIAYQSKAPVAVHDLGGSTFTAAVVRGLATLGQPVELDLGGADLDELVFEHVREAAGDRMPTDPASLARLRQACTAAKETLSADTEAEIPVADTRIRLTRAEFEELARPLLAETAVALRMTIEESGVTPATVLLAGGAAWLPLLTQVVSEELGRPVTATPPGAAAMGAALAASGVPAGPAFPNEPAFRNQAGIPAGLRPAALGAAGPNAANQFAQGAENLGAATEAAPPRRVDQPTRLALNLEPAQHGASAGEIRTSLVQPVRPPVPTAAAPTGPRTKRSRTMMAVAAAAFVVVAAGAAFALTRGQTPPGAGAETMPTTTTVTETVPVTTTPTTTTPATKPTRDQQAPQKERTTSRPRPTTTTTKPTTTTETTTTTTAPTTTSTTNNTPARGPETSEGGDR